MMDTFRELYETAKEARTVRQMTAVYMRWEKKGDEILGRMVGVNEVTSSLGGGTYNQYLFETDDGLVKFALGKSGDGEIGAVLHKDKIYRIEFRGQEELTGGRRVNKFTCEEIGFSDEVESVADKGE